MKKYIPILLVSILLISSIACGSTSETAEEPSNVTTGEESSTAENTDGEEDASSEQEIQAAQDADITIQEQVVFEQNDIIITVKSLDFEDSFFGPSLKLIVENNSTQNITAQIRNLSINNIMVESIFSCDVVSGKKANDEITFMSSSLDTANIEIIKNIEFSFHIFDNDSWDTIVDSEAISIETSADPSYVQEYDNSGFTAVDSNDITIIVKKLDSEDSFWGAELFVVIENNSGENITVQARNVSINGFMVDPIFSCEVVSGKVAFDTITFMESDLADNDISDITSIELEFHVFNTDSWDTIFDSDIVTITFD